MLSLLTRVTVEGTIGAGELNASVGIPGGPRLVLEDVAFTFVFLREECDRRGARRYWLALEAEAGGVELEGILALSFAVRTSASESTCKRSFW